MLWRALILRPLRKDWGRTALSLLAIALGVAVVIAIRVANRAAIASFASTTQSLAAHADLLVTGPAPIPLALLPRLFPLNAHAEITPYLDRRAWDPVHHDALEVLGLDLLATSSQIPPGAAQPRPPRGTAAPPLILIPSTYATRHGLRPGSRLSLAMGGSLHLFRIALAPTSAGAFALLDLPEALADFEPHGPPTADGLRVTLAPGVNRDAFAHRLDALLPAADSVLPPEARIANQATLLAAFRANLAALSYVALLVGLFLIYNTISISVVRRRPAVATLRALGATRHQILRLFLAEGALLGLAGGACGALAGWALAAGALTLVQRTVSNLYTGAAAVPASATLASSDWIWALALALAAGLLGAWAPARQAAGIRPAQALRAGSAEGRVRARLPWAAAAAVFFALAALVCAQLPAFRTIPWFGFASALAAVLAWAALTPIALAHLLPRLRRGSALPGLAAASLAGALRRSSIVVIAVATAIGIMLGVAIMVGSFRATVHTWIAQQLQNDVFVQAADWDRTRPVPLLPAVIAAVSATPGVRAVAASHTQSWTFQGKTVVVNTRWRLRGPAALPVYHFLSGGPPVAPGQILASEPFARRFHLWTGDRFSFAGARSQATFRIAGVFYDYSSQLGEVVFSPAQYQQLFGSLRGNGRVDSGRQDRGREMGFPSKSHFVAGEKRRPAPPLDRSRSGEGGADQREAVGAEPQAKAGCACTPTELGLDAAPGISPAALRRRVQLAAPAGAALVVADNASLRHEAMSVFDQTFRITYALELITLLVAILGVANTLLAVVLERSSEFAVLRFLGATTGQIRRLLLSESALIACFALALGWGMGIVLAIILARVINVQSFGWSIQFYPPYLFLALASLLVWCATVAAGWLPARAAHHHATPAALELQS